MSTGVRCWPTLLLTLPTNVWDLTAAEMSLERLGGNLTLFSLPCHRTRVLLNPISMVWTFITRYVYFSVEAFPYEALVSVLKVSLTARSDFFPSSPQPSLPTFSFWSFSCLFPSGLNYWSLLSTAFPNYGYFDLKPLWIKTFYCLTLSRGLW